MPLPSAEHFGSGAEGMLRELFPRPLEHVRILY